MTTTVSYPSAEFPAPAGVSVTAPEGWEPLAALGPLLAVGKTPREERTFQPNVVVTSIRTLGVTLEEAATTTVDSMRTSNEWAENGQAFVDGLGGRPCFRIEGAFSSPEAGTVYQAALTTVVPRGPFVDIVQVVGSCTASQVKECLPLIREMLASATLTD